MRYLIGDANANGVQGYTWNANAIGLANVTVLFIVSAIACIIY